jgi:hypothetical protein
MTAKQLSDRNLTIQLMDQVTVAVLIASLARADIFYPGGQWRASACFVPISQFIIGFLCGYFTILCCFQNISNLRLDVCLIELVLWEIP